MLHGLIQTLLEIKNLAFVMADLDLNPQAIAYL